MFHRVDEMKRLQKEGNANALNANCASTKKAPISDNASKDTQPCE